MTEPRWLSEDELVAWLRFAAVLELLPSTLDAQLGRDQGLTHFDYFSLAMLAESADQTLRMSDLASRTHATLPRLSRVISRLERADLVRRTPCPGDGRATNVTLTGTGLATLQRAAPGHVATVRSTVIDALSPDEVAQLSTICARVLERLDPAGQTFAPRGGRQDSSAGL